MQALATGRGAKWVFWHHFEKEALLEERGKNGRPGTIPDLPPSPTEQQLNRNAIQLFKVLAMHSITCIYNSVI